MTPFLHRQFRPGHSSLAVVFTAVTEIELYGSARTQKQTDPAGIRIVVLRNQTLVAAHVPGTYPALEGQGLNRAIHGQPAGHMNIRAGVNGLRRRLRRRKRVKHDICVEVVDVPGEAANFQTIGQRTGDTKMNRVAGGNTLFGVSVQSRQVKGLMRRNSILGCLHGGWIFFLSYKGGSGSVDGRGRQA